MTNEVQSSARLNEGASAEQDIGSLPQKETPKIHVREDVTIENFETHDIYRCLDSSRY